MALGGDDVVARGAACRGRPSRADGSEGGADPADVTPAGFNLRTMVHEYGGGAYCVADGVAFCSSFDDQRLYRVDAGSSRSRSRLRSREGGTATRTAGSRRTGSCGSACASAMPRAGVRPTSSTSSSRSRLTAPASRWSSPRAGTSTPARASHPTAAALLPRLGPPVDAVGRMRSVHRQSSAPTGLCET